MKTHTSRLLKFLHLSKPLQNVNMGLESLTPKAKHLQQFPQPTRPINSSNIISPRFSVGETRIPYSIDQRYFPAATATPETKTKTGEEEGEIMLYQKFVPSPSGQHNNVPTTKTSTRGLHRPVDGATLRLDRFRIRTVVGDAVVKEEEKKKY